MTLNQAKLDEAMNALRRDYSEWRRANCLDEIAMFHAEAHVRDAIVNALDAYAAVNQGDWNDSGITPDFDGPR